MNELTYDFCNDPLGSLSRYTADLRQQEMDRIQRAMLNELYTTMIWTRRPADSLPKTLGIDWSSEPAPIDPNAGMIDRDRRALYAPKATTVALPTPPLTTAHPAIKGLSFLAAVDHRFGVRVVHGD